ncbi:hypothetical protein AA0119_g6881 [Alternaria tenuissima]|uniref:DUF7918 domain-containing protein n=2 Tax=Alternaria alternata complex TaxID=187734 RepID=A0A4Q4NHF0_ALTAL|nr:hypothetical protein AA0117_g5449 [Alternaria alternata]RYN98701.1 hypothetical protein AA0119_g6881 [Alternaria tenuissima]
MAIHNDYPGLTVQIICGGKPIEEHVNEEDEERDEPKTTTRYVECQSNTEFAIKTTFRPPFAPLDLAIHVHLDGIKVNGLIVHKHQMLNETYVKSATKWKEGQKWRASKFVFSDLNVVQEDSETLAEKNMDALSQVGTISVVITPILSMLKERRPKGRKRELKEFGMISEETVKGDVRSHVIGFETHIAAAALKSLGIVSRSLSPSQDTQPESITKGNTTKLSPDCCHRDTSSIVTSQAETASITPGLLQQSPTPINQRMQSGLTKKDILVLIKHYRGSSAGLEGLPEKDLAILFSSYRGDKPNETPINQEPVLSESRARIKRELVGDSVARGQGKKRKVEIIVLDD